MKRINTILVIILLLTVMTESKGQRQAGNTVHYVGRNQMHSISESRDERYTGIIDNRYYYVDLEDINIDFRRTERELIADIKYCMPMIRRLNKSLMICTGEKWRDIIESNVELIDDFMYDMREIELYYRPLYNYDNNSKRFTNKYYSELIRLKKELQLDKMGRMRSVSDQNEQVVNVSERKTLYRDGTLWQYYINNELMVAQTNATTRDYGKWHRIDILISNTSVDPIEFDPARDITAFSIDKREREMYLAVFSSDQYMKKVRRSQNWQAALVGLGEAFAASSAGYSTSTTNTNSSYSGRSNSYGRASAYGSGGYAYGSYSGNSSYSGSSHTRSTTTTYDAAAAYQAQVISQQRMAAFAEAQLNERNAKQMGYLKRNTIFPGETIQGYVHIKRISGHSVYITMSINGARYSYGWTY